MKELLLKAVQQSVVEAYDAAESAYNELTAVYHNSYAVDAIRAAKDELFRARTILDDEAQS